MPCQRIKSVQISHLHKCPLALDSRNYETLTLPAPVKRPAVFGIGRDAPQHCVGDG